MTAFPARNTILLTGATGLLGQYLLRDLFRSSRMVAVLVRPRRAADVRARIDALLSYWEDRLGRILPRPRVLVGDLKSNGLALSECDRNWIRCNVHRVVHCAASVRFLADEKNGEPMESNFHGTRRILETSIELGIPHFHHVSTAYVVGTSSKIAREVAHERPSEFTNPYEESKYLAEGLLRDVSHRFESIQIYRPSVIIGDSSTGFSSTFHTIYSALRFLRSIDQRQIHRSDWLLEKLQLTGSERKNLVPVDWVSRSITSLIDLPEARGKTFHLTSRRPVSIQVIAESLWEASRAEPDGWTAMANDFPIQEIDRAATSTFEAFRGYFRDDPLFDSSELERCLPNQSCPEVDRDLLVRCFRFAIRQRMQAMVYPMGRMNDKYETLDRIESNPLPMQYHYELQLTGAGGGIWHIASNAASQNAVVLRTSRNHWDELVRHPDRLRASLLNHWLILRAHADAIELDANVVLRDVATILRGSSREVPVSRSSSLLLPRGFEHA